jgi:hypothetical protein
LGRSLITLMANERRRHKPVRLMIGALTILSIAGLSCSGDSGNDDKRQAAARKDESAFNDAVNNATRTWGPDAAARFFDKVTQETPGTSEVKAFNETGLAVQLCREVDSFEPDPASNGDIDSRSDSVMFAKQSAKDSAVAGLLEYALADPGQRDQRLTALKVGQSASQTKPPIESMTGAGILDTSGKLAIPATVLFTGESESDVAYERFRTWISKESPALLQSSFALTAGIDEALDACKTTKN